MALPTSAQIALALAVAKSKPIDVSFEEYFGQIREIIVDQPRKEPIDHQQYIDGVLFWKRAYEKCEDEKVVLQNKVFVLEQELQNLRTVSSEQELSVFSKKRKIESPKRKQNTKANIQSKRQAIETGPQTRILMDEADFIIATAPTSRRTLLRCLQNLHQTRREEKNSIQSFSQTIISLCHAVAGVVKDSCQPSRPILLAGKDFSVVDDAFKVVSYSWRMIMDALDDLTTTSRTVESLPCIPVMVFLFQTLLGQLHQISLDEADLRVGTIRKKTIRRQTNSVGAHCELGAGEQHGKRCKLIATLLRNMLGSVDTTGSLHRQVLEGFLCALLDHIGSSLSLMVFANSNLKSPSEPGLLAPQGLTDVCHIETDVAILTANLAAPYLIHVLHKAIEVCGSLTVRSSSEQALRDDSIGLGSSQLSSSIKARFQETLLQGIYGSDNKDFESGFQRCVEAASIHREEPSLVAEQAKNDPTWFISQIWEHIGWDILVSKLEVPCEESN